MFDLGIQELIVIFIVALIVFGPKRLPELGRTIGKGMSELKRAMNGVRDQMQSEFESVNKTAELKYPPEHTEAESGKSETSPEQDNNQGKEERKEDKADGR
ncbi:MAG: Sec-independent protein translocase protein TatB [Nitrospirota bacterium]